MARKLKSKASGMLTGMLGSVSRRSAPTHLSTLSGRPRMTDSDWDAVVADRARQGRPAAIGPRHAASQATR